MEQHSLEYCKSILDFANSKVSEIDQKASFLTGISSLVFVVVADTFGEQGSWTRWWDYPMRVLTLVPLLISFFYAIRVVIPATENTQVLYQEPLNDFFCKWITSRSREQYRRDVLARESNGALDNYLNEAYTLAEILNEKYRLVRRSSKALALAISLLVLQLLVAGLTRLGLL